MTTVRLGLRLSIAMKGRLNSASLLPKVGITSASAYNNLGNLAFIRGDMESSLADYTQAAEKDPKDAQVHLNLARFYLKQGKPQKASASYEKAISLDKSLREQYPDVSSLTP